MQLLLLFSFYSRFFSTGADVLPAEWDPVGVQVNQTKPKQGQMPARRSWTDRIHKIYSKIIFKKHWWYLYTRFEHRCVAYDKALNKYAVSYTAINSFIPDRTPR